MAAELIVMRKQVEKEVKHKKEYIALQTQEPPEETVVHVAAPGPQAVTVDKSIPVDQPPPVEQSRAADFSNLRLSATAGTTQRTMLTTPQIVPVPARMYPSLEEAPVINAEPGLNERLLQVTDQVAVQVSDDESMSIGLTFTKDNEINLNEYDIYRAKQASLLSSYNTTRTNNSATNASAVTQGGCCAIL